MSESRLKMCQACRGLIAADSAVCPLCGAQAHYAGGGATAVAGALTVTGVIFTLNLIFYALSLLLTTRLREGNAGFDFTPNGFANYLLGSAQRGAIVDGQYWRLVTYAFLHGGIMHILFNSLALIQAGRLAEEAFGRAKFICLYLVAAVCGGLAAFIGSSGLVGASGAIFGLIGATAVYGYKRRDSYGQALKSAMVQWLIYGAIISFLPGISWQAHLLGLAGGAGMAWFLGDAEETAQSYRRAKIWQVAAALSWLLIIASFVLMSLGLRATMETVRIQLLSDRVFQAGFDLERWNRLNKNESLQDYSGALGASVTSLEMAATVDAESEAIRQRMLAAMRARHEQLKQHRDSSIPPPDQSQMAAYQQAFDDYYAWLKRRAASLGVRVEELHPDWTLHQNQQ
ncbi:MAG TPA: rhomboid family intramembrane serine protease [Blastocatellia bacterium]|nr:rhomboid family intramembrane serine protease [Blastocatellia bacterium]